MRCRDIHDPRCRAMAIGSERRAIPGTSGTPGSRATLPSRRKVDRRYRPCLVRFGKWRVWARSCIAEWRQSLGVLALTGGACDIQGGTCQGSTSVGMAESSTSSAMVWRSLV